MKYFLNLLGIASMVWVVSCTKTMTVEHDIHDTVYLSTVRVDTFHSIVVFTDTVIKQDNRVDTLVQVRHDTLILTKTIVDTLFQALTDTIYLTRALHDTVVQVKTVIQHDTVVTIKNVLVPDTVNKYVYVHDTINNIIKVIEYDTVLSVKTIIEHDTVTNYVTTNWLNYPVPAPDSGQLLYITFDTMPGLVLHSIEFRNIYSWVQTSSSPGSQMGFFSQDFVVTKLEHNPFGGASDWQVYVPGPMVCNIVINYDWVATTYPTFKLSNFLDGPGVANSWTTTAPGGLGGGSLTIHQDQSSEFDYINLPRIFQLTISN